MGATNCVKTLAVSKQQCPPAGQRHDTSTVHITSHNTVKKTDTRLRSKITPTNTTTEDGC